MTTQDKDRIKCAIRHIESSLDVDPWAAEIAVEAMKTQLPGEGTTFDLISRQAAIDTEGLEEEIRCEMCRNQMKTNRGCDGNCKYDEKLYEKITQILDKRITPLLSAQPESNWIPVSERLPEYGVAVLTYDGHCFCVEKRIPTIRDDEGEPITGDWWVSDDYDEYDCDYYPNLRDGACIAWMPLPEPYRAERRTDEQT